MSSAQSSIAGWHPDPETGGTKYWDGTRWTGDARPPRKTFAAASSHMGWGITLLVVGGLTLVGSPANIATAIAAGGSSVAGPAIASFVFALVFGAGLIAWGTYLVRGKGVSTKSVAAKAQATRDYESAVGWMTGEVAASSKPRAALVTGLLAVQAAAARRFGQAQAQAVLDHAFAEMNFDPGSLSAHQIGQIPGLAVYPDWVIVGTSAFDLTGATRAQFHLDDARMVTTSTQQGKRTVSTSVEAPRGGHVQLVSSDWSQNVMVSPQGVSDARRLVEQIGIRVDQLKGDQSAEAHGRTSVEVEQIRAISNPETAQALQNLQNLLFTRVISDEEFARMKAKLLADPSTSL